MVTAMIAIFVLGYVLITLEHPLHINKATFALITCGVLWSILALMGNDPHIHDAIVNQLGDACEIVVFLIGAMTIVEIIDRYGGSHSLPRTSTPAASVTCCGSCARCRSLCRPCWII